MPLLLIRVGGCLEPVRRLNKCSGEARRNMLWLRLSIVCVAQRSLIGNVIEPYYSLKLWC